MTLTYMPLIDRFYLETGVSKGHVSQIINGQRSPSLATMVKLAKALEVDVVDLLSPGRSDDRRRMG